MSDKDEHGYPTEEALQRLKEWPYTEGFEMLMEYVEHLWTYKDCFYFDPYNKTYVLVTGGWSGNEDVIAALRQNLMFWGACWESSHRNGKHTFIVRPMFQKENNCERD